MITPWLKRISVGGGRSFLTRKSVGVNNLNLINDENVSEIIEGTEREVRAMLENNECDVRMFEILATLLEINKYLVDKTK